MRIQLGRLVFSIHCNCYASYSTDVKSRCSSSCHDAVEAFFPFVLSFFFAACMTSRGVVFSLSLSLSLPKTTNPLPVDKILDHSNAGLSDSNNFPTSVLIVVKKEKKPRLLPPAAHMLCSYVPWKCQQWTLGASSLHISTHSTNETYFLRRTGSSTNRPGVLSFQFPQDSFGGIFFFSFSVALSSFSSTSQAGRS